MEQQAHSYASRLKEFVEVGFLATGNLKKWYKCLATIANCLKPVPQ